MNGFEDIVRGVATRVATRVVICPRWVITSLRPSRPVRDRGVWRRALRESGALADPIVNRGRQKSRARARVREHGACLDLWQFRRGAKKEEAGVKTHRREEWHGRQIYIYIYAAWISFHDGPSTFVPFRWNGPRDTETPVTSNASNCCFRAGISSFSPSPSRFQKVNWFDGGRWVSLRKGVVEKFSFHGRGVSFYSYTRDVLKIRGTRDGTKDGEGEIETRNSNGVHEGFLYRSFQRFDSRIMQMEENWIHPRDGFFVSRVSLLDLQIFSSIKGGGNGGGKRITLNVASRTSSS